MAALTILLAALNGTSQNNGTGMTISTQPLAFHFPHHNQSTKLQYHFGNQVNVSWTTPFEHTTVELWQGPSENGQFFMQTVAANLTRNDTSILWEAGPVDNSSSINSFHFRLQKGHVPNMCSDCMINGPTFQINGVPSFSQTNGSTPTEASPSASSTPPTSSSSTSNSTRLALGLGLGLGWSAAIALVTLLWFFLKRQEKRMSEEDDVSDAKAAAVAKREKDDKMRYSSGNDSAATQESYHSSFHFEETPQEGFLAFWHRIFGR